MPPQPAVAYESSHPFESARIQAAAVYCSDGRYGEQFDEFLQQGLRLGVSPLQLETQQREDMRKAVLRVHTFGPSLRVEAYIALRNAGRVWFERIEIGVS